jgi:replicative superfamily II helicase
MAYPDKYKIIEQDFPNLLNDLNNNVVREKIALSFPFIQKQSEIEIQLSKALEIIELKTIELWNNNENDDFIQYCSNYLDIALLLQIPQSNIEKIFHTLKIISFGYLGEDWQKVRKFLIDKNEELTNCFETNGNWNEYLFTQIYLAIFYIIRKKSWEDLSKAISIINNLRIEQKNKEKQLLENIYDFSEQKAIAFDLASLYHLAKIVELIATYQNEGKPNDVNEQLDFHFENAQKYCAKSKNIELDLLLRYLQPTFKKIISNSIWTVAKGINSRVTKFVQSITKSQNPVFELLYPQRKAVFEGLLDPANKAVVVNLPTSSGKTLIAEFRILQALNQYSDQKGWVVYTVPTRALVNQIYIRLKKDLSQAPLSLKIEKMSGALELDAFEEHLITEQSDFNILITTYEKLSLLIRQGIEQKINRPLALVVVDEAHNIEEKSRGLRLELMLSTIKKDIDTANYLLLTPEIPNAEDIGKWLSDSSSKSISIGLNWQPNERMIGEIYAKGKGKQKNVETYFKSLLTTKKTLSIDDDILLQKYNDCDYNNNELKTKNNLTALVASEFYAEEGILVIVGNPKYTYEVAEKIYNLISKNDFQQHEDVVLVQKFIASELGDNFPLVKFLDRGIGVHSSALPDEIKFLIEQLMEAGHLKYLVCTTTIAQGINFPVSAIFMASYSYPYTSAMPTKDFWNLAGRAGRIGQKSIGIVGIAIKDEEDRNKLANYLKLAANDLVSVLLDMVKDLDEIGSDFNLGRLYYKPEWSDFLQYISHLLLQSQNLENFLTEVDLSLRRTYGYNKLPNDKKELLKKSVIEYAKKIKPGLPKLSDSTGFSTETIWRTMNNLKEIGINRDDWQKDKLFSTKNDTLKKLVGIMLNTAEIKQNITDIATFNKVADKTTIANIITDWVSGKSIEQIAQKYYSNDISKCTKAIYSDIVNSATWGIAAMQQLPQSGINWDNLTEIERRQFKNLPSMIYYGVNSEEAVLLRKENIPRTIANNLGKELEKEFKQTALTKNSQELVSWLNNLAIEKWQTVIPANKKITGDEYKKIWRKLAGIE